MAAIFRGLNVLICMSIFLLNVPFISIWMRPLMVETHACTLNWNRLSSNNEMSE